MSADERSAELRRLTEMLGRINRLIDGVSYAAYSRLDGAELSDLGAAAALASRAISQVKAIEAAS